MRYLPFIICFVSISMLSGCAVHLTKQQCMSINWYQVGFRDGSAGRQQNNLQNAIQDCAKFQLTVDTKGYKQGWVAGTRLYCAPTYQMGMTDGMQGKSMDAIVSRQPFCQRANLTLNMTAYNNGRKNGLKQFCTYQSGFNIGYQGKQLPDVCPKNLRGKFMTGWKAGAKKFCSRPSVGFALGKQGRPYPTACAMPYYPQFKSEYDRGVIIHNRIVSVQSQIDAVGGQIDDIASRWDMFNVDGVYIIYGKKSPKARRALERINMLLIQKQNLQSQLFQAQAMR